MTSSVDDVVPLHQNFRDRKLKRPGPWESKSGAQLSVVFAFSQSDLERKFFRYSDKELERIPKEFEIRGARLYCVAGIPRGSIGGTEFHRIREEMVFGFAGAVRWMCEDLSGAKREFVITKDIGIWMPPYVLHTYESLEDNSGLLVFANTLFDPDDSKTSDSYSAEEFLALQASR